MQKLSVLTRPEIETIRANANLTEDEEEIFCLLAKGYCIRQVAFDVCLSERTVLRRKQNILIKIARLFDMEGHVDYDVVREYVKKHYGEVD